MNFYKQKQLNSVYRPKMPQYPYNIVLDYFAKTAWERIVLVDNHWSHYPIVQQIEKGNFKPPVTKNVSAISDYYIRFSSPATNKIVKLLEYNGPTNFYPLVEKGIDVHVYKKGELLDTASQLEPDNVFDFRYSQYRDKRIHGMDNKAYENPREFESKIFSAIPQQRYISSISKGLINAPGAQVPQFSYASIADLPAIIKEHIAISLKKTDYQLAIQKSLCKGIGTNTNASYYQLPLSILITTPSRITTYLHSNKSTYIHISKRTMINSRCIHATRALYHAFTVISNTETINKFNKNNPKPLIDNVVGYALNDSQGIPQHKATVFKHLSTHQFQGEVFYESFIDHTGHQIVKYEPHTNVDFRVLNELKVLDAFIKHFGSDLNWLYATLDSRPANFPHAHQSNPDFWVSIDKMFGFNRRSQNRVTYHDEKSGMDMFKHSSKGSLGVIYYDHNGKNIQMTSKPIEIKDLVIYNEDKLNKLTLSLINDGLYNDDHIKKVMAKAKLLQIQMQNKSVPETFELHNSIQNLLWNEIQCDPNFTQSVSFIFLQQVTNQPVTSQEMHFSHMFQSKLQPNKMYNLNKKGDYMELYRAFIYAGNEIDPLFSEKLFHYHNNGLLLTEVLRILVMVSLK